MLDKLGKTLCAYAFRKQKIAMLTNLERSEYIPFYRGTRQAYLLSPLLFNLALKPLAISIRHYSAIRSITVGCVEMRLSLYADDLLLFLKDAVDAFPPLLDLINIFGSFSWYSINWKKNIFISLGSNFLIIFRMESPSL